VRLRKEWYGYVCAWDRRVQFRALDWCSLDTRRRGELGWEVRLNGRRGRHFFRTLAEAKAWARSYWWPALWPVRARFEAALPPGPVSRQLLLAALRGDETAFMALMDLCEETGAYLGQSRTDLLRACRKVGMFVPQRAVA
jgi:hypothetical protein